VGNDGGQQLLTMTWPCAGWRGVGGSAPLQLPAQEVFLFCFAVQFNHPGCLVPGLVFVLTGVWICLSVSAVMW
jgi:hypothetical protein